jgi:aspartate 1-decarboxylase
VAYAMLDEKQAPQTKAKVIKVDERNQAKD